MTDLTRERLAGLIATIRHGVGEAMVMADIANYAGDGPPFSAGYDDVHDACNAIWAASHAIDLLDKETAPASGGVSGEDGELIADVQKALIRLRMDDPRITDQTPRAKAITTLEHALRALLAERDGLKKILDLLDDRNHILENDAKDTNAALADALGLLREIQIEPAEDGDGDILSTSCIERRWIDRRSDLLAKHGPSP